MSSFLKLAGTTFLVLQDSEPSDPATLIPKSQRPLLSNHSNPNPSPNLLSPIVKTKSKPRKHEFLEKKPVKKDKIEKIRRKKKKKKKRSKKKREESSDESDVDTLQSLFEPYTKPQLVDLVADAALKDSSFFDLIRDAADRDPARRKIFVHGLASDATREALLSHFKSSGDIENCVVVKDRATGRAKGCGVVLFKTRGAAIKALKQPRRQIGNRVVSCHLASDGPTPGQQAQDTTGRKIFVRNVPEDTDPEKLLKLFAKFGEIEMGPMGFDVRTGKSRGFALFLYKSQDGAMNALEEPYKLFEGYQLHCHMAADPLALQPQHPQPQPQPQLLPTPPALAAVAAAQNMMFSQNATLHPAYGGLRANPNSIYMNAQGLNHPNQMGQVSQLAVSPLGAEGFRGYNVSSHGFPSLGGNLSGLGPYGSSAQSMGLQQIYQNSQFGLPDSDGAK